MPTRRSQPPVPGDPNAIATPVAFGEALKSLRTSAHISIRRMQSASEARAARTPRSSLPTLSKHRIETMEKGKHLASVDTEQLDLYLSICQVPDTQMHAWRTALSRVREIGSDQEMVSEPLHEILVRQRYIELLDEALQHARQRGGWGTLVVSGGPGYGKTTLANHWTTRVKIPTFTIWLRGQTTGRMTDAVTAHDALLKLCRFLKLNTSEYDGISDYDAADEFRQIASDHRILVVMDDAANESQIERLIPTERERFYAIVTSRSPLTYIRTSGYSQHIQLQRLSVDDSVELLKLNISPALIRSASELRTLARYSCGIPLALRILAADIEGHYTTPTNLVQILKEEGAALDTFSPNDPEEERSGALMGNFRTIIQTSYQLMDDQAQQIYRMLSARLGRRTDSYSVSLVADLSLESAEKVVRKFESFGLIDRANGFVFDIHDLLHEFASKQCSDEETRVALSRLSAGFYGAVNLAFNLVNRGNPMVDHAYVSSWDRRSDAEKWVQSNYSHQTIDWFIDHQAAILDLTKHSCEIAPPAPFGPRLAASLFYFLEITNSWHDLESITKIALAAMEEHSDPITKGYLLRNNARLMMMRIRDSLDQIRSGPLPPEDVYRSERSCQSAIDLYETCIPLLRPDSRFPNAGNVALREIADTRLQLARISPTASNLEAARGAYDLAAQQFEGSENPTASLSLSFGEVLRMMGRFDEALQRFEIALVYALTPIEGRPFRHGPLGGHGLAKQAYLFTQIGSQQDAVKSFDRSIEIFHAYGNWLDEARTLARKAHLLSGVIGKDEARSALEQSEKLLRQNGRSEADVASQWLGELGAASDR